MKKKKYILGMILLLINLSFQAMAEENKLLSVGSIKYEEEIYFTNEDLQYLEEEINKLKSE